jgi:hypothetical protein
MHFECEYIITPVKNRGGYPTETFRRKSIQENDKEYGI